MSDIDHKDEAESCLIDAHNTQAGWEISLVYSNMAQAHAILDAAEQQQLANLIAYAASHYPDARTETGDAIHARIREGLGLA